MADGGWWKGVMSGSQQQQPPDQGQSKQQIVDSSGNPVSSSFKPPQTEAELQDMIRNQIVKVNQDFNEFQGKYNNELKNYTDKFLASDLAPYSEMAFDFFKKVQAVNPGAPIASLYNMTVEFVQGQKNAGVKPPSQNMPRPHGGSMHIPGGGMSIAGDGRFRNDEGEFANRIGSYSDEQRKQDATDYTNARIRQHEYHKTQGLSGMLMDDYYNELRSERARAASE